MPLETPTFDVERSPIVERSQALQEIVKSIDPQAALPQDRVSCHDERLFLSGMLRRPDRPMTEIIEILKRKLESSKISEGRRREIAEHIAQLRPCIAPPVEPIDEMSRRSARMPGVILISPNSLPVSPLVDPEAFIEDENSPTRPRFTQPSRVVDAPSRAVITMPVLAPSDFEEISPDDLDPVDEEEEAPLQRGPVTTALSGHAVHAKRPMREAELPVLSEEELAEQSALRERERKEAEARQAAFLNQVFVSARAAAERWAAREIGPESFDEMVEATVDGAAVAHTDLETMYGFSVELVRGRVTDELAAAYFEALERAGDHSPEFRDSFRAYVNLRARLGALLRAESRARPLVNEGVSGEVLETVMTLPVARNVLGVFDDAGRNDVEKAYVIRLQALDLQEAVDEPVIADLMRAREVLLEDIEQRETEQERAREAADVVSVPEAEGLDVPPRHQADRWYIEALRRPGQILRGLFFGGVAVAGVGAGAVALHEFAEKHTDPMHDVGHDYSLGVIPGPFDGVNIGDLFPEAKATAPKPVETPVEQIRLIPHGSWILKETGAMLRERGLKPTNQLTSYFGHLIEVVNAEAIAAAGGAEHLPDNFPLIVTPIVEEMNAMAGIAPAASEPSVASTKSSSEKTSVVSGGSSVEKVSAVHQDRVVPTVDSPMRVMAKGEYLGKVTHSMLRAGGLNWTTARINQLNAMVWEQNLPLFERLVKEGKMRKLKPEYIPIGVELDFSTAAQEVQRLVKAKKPAKKGG